MKRSGKQTRISQSLTSREPIPHLQPIVFALALSTGQRVILEVKGQEAECDVHAGGHDDDEVALKVVGILVRKPWGLDEARGTGEVLGAVGTCGGKHTETIYLPATMDGSHPDRYRMLGQNQPTKEYCPP